MRLLWAVACRSYELHKDGTVDIERAGVDALWVESLPVELSVTVIFRLGLLEGEEADLEIQLLSPGMVGLGVLSVPFRGEPGPGHQPGFEIPVVQPVVLLFPAETPGIYSAEIYSNGRTKDSLFLSVRTGSPD